MNEDFIDLFRSLLREDARFIVVGAYAMAAHGIPRATSVLGRDDLIANKRAAGRPKDLVDLAVLDPTST
ncbi:MAG: hypothetical protein JJE39_07440 [Vicinamibacteria bacterium]|nr:hypothetical protein [Vicinamibacteria bacterium]